MQAAPAPALVPNVLSRQVLAQGGAGFPSVTSANTGECCVLLPVATLFVRRTPTAPRPTLIPPRLLPITVLSLTRVSRPFPVNALKPTPMPTLSLTRLSMIWQPGQLLSCTPLYEGQK